MLGLEAPSTFFLVLLLQELRLFVSPRTNPDTDTGTCPIPPVTVFRVKAYCGRTRESTARGFTLAVDLSLTELPLDARTVTERQIG